MKCDLFQTILPVSLLQPKLKNINVDNLKLRPIIDQTGTYIYNASKVVAKYLKTLAKNQFTIIDTLSLPSSSKSAVNYDEYEDVFYDVESLFTSVSVKETVEYILHKRYVEKLIKPRYQYFFWWNELKNVYFL